MTARAWGRARGRARGRGWVGTRPCGSRCSCGCSAFRCHVLLLTLFWQTRIALFTVSPDCSRVGRGPRPKQDGAAGARGSAGVGPGQPLPRAQGARSAPRQATSSSWARPHVGRAPATRRWTQAAQLLPSRGPRDTSLSHGSQSLGEAVRLRTAAPSGAQFAGRRASYFPLGAAVPLLGHTGRLDQMTPQSSQFLPPCKPGCACPRDPANARARGGGAGPAAWGTQDAWQNLPVLQVS